MKNKYDVSIFIVNESEDYIYINDYDKDDDGDCVFLCITNDVLNSDCDDNNSIYLYKDWNDDLTRLINEPMFRFKNLAPYTFRGSIYAHWQFEDKCIPDNDKFRIEDRKADKSEFVNQVNGYAVSHNVISNVIKMKNDGHFSCSLEEYIPAIMLTHHLGFDFNGRYRQGYLPAIGQLVYIHVNYSYINKVMYRLFDKEKIPQEWYNLQSSTECNHSYVWTMYNGVVETFDKYNRTGVLPIYKMD